MNSLTVPEKLCPLKTCEPNFHIEGSRNRNKSHSPQPPMRKRLYSEDFNFILLDSESKKDIIQSKEITNNIKSDIGIDLEYPIMEESRVFPEEIRSICEKNTLFKEHVEIGDNIDNFEDNSSMFELGPVPLQEENVYIDENLEYLVDEDNKQDFKLKSHFMDIFNPEKKETENSFDSMIGKRNYTNTNDKSIIQRNNSFLKSKNQTLKLQHQEYSTYFLKSKRIKSSSKENQTFNTNLLKKQKLLNQKTNVSKKKLSLNNNQKVSNDKKIVHIQG